jgi:hypothetical protein
MASDRRIAANRLNATKSTGPRTEDGKQRSRLNALRHGLTAETIVNVLEDSAEYEVFETEIRGDYQPRTAIEHQLVVRLASLLWRLRRATAIESGLLQIQAEVVIARAAHKRAEARHRNARLSIFYSLGVSQPESIEIAEPKQSDASSSALTENSEGILPLQSEMARAFLRLAKTHRGVFERLGRYETNLWRQTAQTVILLNSFKQKISRSQRFTDYRFGRTRPRPPSFFPPHFYK